MRRVLGFLAIVFVAGCSLSERSDYLVGRECEEDRDCDQAQRCLPHAYVNDRYDDYRCRDRASFDPSPGFEPPLAFCDDVKLICPGDLECNADRVRLDASARRRVCKQPNDVFSPPSDAGI